MTQRAEYGSLTLLSKDEYRQYKAGISKQWRKDNPQRVKDYNRSWYLYRKNHPTIAVICKICGKEFYSYRPTAKICPKCLEKRKK